MTSLPSWRGLLAACGTALRSRRVARSLVALAALAAAAYLFRDAIFGAPVNVSEVVRGDIVQTVVASGRVTTPQRVSVGAVITERVARIPVEEGQTVRQGDVLIELDDRDERAAYAQAQAAVAQAEAKLRQLREVGLPAAEQSLRQARREPAVSPARSTSAISTSRRKASSANPRSTTRSATSTLRRASMSAAHLQVRSNAPDGQRLSDGGDRARAGAGRARLGRRAPRADDDPRARPPAF